VERGLAKEKARVYVRRKDASENAVIVSDVNFTNRTVICEIRALENLKDTQNRRRDDGDGDSGNGAQSCQNTSPSCPSTSY